MGRALSFLNVPSGADTYSAALEGLVGVDEAILRRNPVLPLLYESGIKYKLKDHNVWRYPHEIIGDGWGDCEGLSCWRTAELRVTGADPNAQVLVYRTAPRRWHAVVGRGDGWIEDPSIVCGMHEKVGMPWTVREVIDHERPWPKAAGCVVGAIDDAFDDVFPAFKVVKHAEGYTGVLSLPMADGGQALVANTSVSKNAKQAQQKAQNIMTDLSAVVNSDPQQLAQLNPYSAAAVQMMADPDVQATLKGGQAVAAKQDTGLLAKPGDFLEQPGVTNVIRQAGPWGAAAASIIDNPLARGIRHASHDVFKKIPGLGRLF